MAQRAYARVAILVGVVFAGGCTRPKPSSQDRPTAIASVTVSDAGTSSSMAAPQAETADANIDDDVQTIALKDAPLITVRTRGPALIELTLASEDPGAWKKIEIERHPATDRAGATQRDTFEQSTPPHVDRARWRRRLHAAVPATSYVYRARTRGAWSPEITVRAPEWKRPPTAPSSPSVRADSPFAAHLSWVSTAQGLAGFEVQIEVKDDFVRAALVDPTEREFVHHMRLPGETSTYRIRAFNARGASPPSPLVTIVMPMPTAAKTATMGPCVAPVRNAPKSSGCNPDIETFRGDDGRVLSNVPGAGFGCNRHLMGEHAGCTRAFGEFQIQADLRPVPGHTDEGWPLLRAIAGAGEYVGADIQTLQFVNGRYSIVDDAQICGEIPSAPEDPTLGAVDSDITRCAPPFVSCQRDTPSL